MASPDACKSAGLTPTPIKDLDSGIDVPIQDSRVIFGTVGVTWPYDSIKRKLAFVLTDSSVRGNRERIRVRLNGAGAEAVSKLGLGAGDEVALKLEGAEWEKDEWARPSGSPAARLKSQLNFPSRVYLTATVGEAQESHTVDIAQDAEPEQPIPTDNLPIEDDSTISIPSTFFSETSKRPSALLEAPKHANGVEHVTPFKRSKRKRTDDDDGHDDSWLVTPGYNNIFEYDTPLFGRSHKKQSTGFRKWRLISRSPSPEPEPEPSTSKDDHDMLVDEPLQTVEATSAARDPTPTPATRNDAPEVSTEATQAVQVTPEIQDETIETCKPVRKVSPEIMKEAPEQIQEEAMLDAPETVEKEVPLETSERIHEEVASILPTVTVPDILADPPIPVDPIQEVTPKESSPRMQTTADTPVIELDDDEESDEDESQDEAIQLNNEGGTSVPEQQYSEEEEEFDEEEEEFFEEDDDVDGYAHQDSSGQVAEGTMPVEEEQYSDDEEEPEDNYEGAVSGRHQGDGHQAEIEIIDDDEDHAEGEQPGSIHHAISSDVEEEYSDEEEDGQDLYEEEETQEPIEEAQGEFENDQEEYEDEDEEGYDDEEDYEDDEAYPTAGFAPLDPTQQPQRAAATNFEVISISSGSDSSEPESDADEDEAEPTPAQEAAPPPQSQDSIFPFASQIGMPAYPEIVHQSHLAQDAYITPNVSFHQERDAEGDDDVPQPGYGLPVALPQEPIDGLPYLPPEAWPDYGTQSMTQSTAYGEPHAELIANEDGTWNAAQGLVSVSQEEVIVEVGVEVSMSTEDGNQWPAANQTGDEPVVLTGVGGDLPPDHAHQFIEAGDAVADKSTSPAADITTFPEKPAVDIMDFAPATIEAPAHDDDLGMIDSAPADNNVQDSTKAETYETAEMEDANEHLVERNEEPQAEIDIELVVNGITSEDIPAVSVTVEAGDEAATPAPAIITETTSIEEQILVEEETVVRPSTSTPVKESSPNPDESLVRDKTPSPAAVAIDETEAQPADEEEPPATELSPAQGAEKPTEELEAPTVAEAKQEAQSAADEATTAVESSPAQAAAVRPYDQEPPSAAEPEQEAQLSPEPVEQSIEVQVEPSPVDEATEDKDEDTKMEESVPSAAEAAFTKQLSPSPSPSQQLQEEIVAHTGRVTRSRATSGATTKDLSGSADNTIASRVAKRGRPRTRGKTKTPSPTQSVRAASVENIESEVGASTTEPAVEPAAEPAAPSAPTSEDLGQRLNNALPECLPLAELHLRLVNKILDVLVVATSSTPASSPRTRAREYASSFNVADPSTAAGTTGPGVVVAELYRPHRDSLPKVKAGDAVLLRRFKVKALAGRGIGLQSTDESSWAVFADDAEVQINGPPMEDIEDETGYAAEMRAWFAGLGPEERKKVDEANEAMLAETAKLKKK